MEMLIALHIAPALTDGPGGILSFVYEKLKYEDGN